MTAIAPTTVIEAPKAPLTFAPFYWRRSSVARVGLAVTLGLVFFVLHFVTSRATIFRDLTWMIGVMIAAAMLFLDYATSTLKNLVTEAEGRLPASSSHLLIRPLQFWLSDRNFLIAGIAFGVLNCIMGYSFGVWYKEVSSKLTIYLGYFVVGFVSGMAAYGVTGVLGFVREVVRDGSWFDYRDPDGCGGTSFLGSALVKFSLLNMTMGVLISIYIVFTHWSHRNHLMVQALMWAWIVFPFVVGFAHLLGPGSLIHAALQEYKRRKRQELAAGVKSIAASLQTQGTNTKALREDLEYQLKLQAELYRMNTWPFPVASRVHLAFSLCLEVVPACFEVWNMLDHSGPHRA